jgi:Holliday junction resolvasome RuvABC ATP-dependent DNA helicase subunit
MKDATVTFTQDGQKRNWTREELYMLNRTYCDTCGSGDPQDDNPILLCDGTKCKRGYHLKCLTPVLDEVPEGDFIGPCCDVKARAVAPLRRLKRRTLEERRSVREESHYRIQRTFGDQELTWRERFKVSHDELVFVLETIVGLQSVKQLLIDLNCKIHLRRQRLVSQAHSQAESLGPAQHILLSGNPGTGKSMIGRIIAKILYSAGMVSQPSFVRVHRSDLVAGFVGQTAIKTREAIQSARGGVMFVDEAHQLLGKGKEDYGPEAYREIMREMLNEGDPRRVTFLFAGYPKEMTQFTSADAGMESRITHRLEFQDYKTLELAQIFVKKLRSSPPGLPNSVSASEEVIAKLMRSFPRVIRSRFNARLVDILIDKAEAVLARRLLVTPDAINSDEDDLNILSFIDLDQAAIQLLNELQTVSRAPKDDD